MNLLIDAGNTRIKWAVVKADQWLRSGTLPTLQAGELSQHVTGYLRDIRQIWVSNVAGEGVARQIRYLGEAASCATQFLVAQAAQCGVHNGYSQPSQLGSDRWAALIAAWHLVQRECLVVSCGTATTIDTLDVQGRFLGGLILPGMELMQRSLVSGTAQIGLEEGRYDLFPRNTADAIFSGVIQAHCGSIMRQYVLLDGKNAPVVMSGGARTKLQNCLEQQLGDASLQMVDDLVLQGLMLIAQESGE
jgi:type III pantothenate kinase